MCTLALLNGFFFRTDWRPDFIFVLVLCCTLKCCASSGSLTRSLRRAKTHIFNRLCFLCLANTYICPVFPCRQHKCFSVGAATRALLVYSSGLQFVLQWQQLWIYIIKTWKHVQHFFGIFGFILLRMMLPHDVTDHAEAMRPDSTEPYRPGGILLFGYLRKLKVNHLSLPINHISFFFQLFCTLAYFSFLVLPFFFLTWQRMKKKFFILTADSESNPARLEYFDSEKKYKNGQTAKRYKLISICKKKTWINIDLLFPGQLSSSHASASTERPTASTSLLWQSTPMKISSQLPLSLRKNYLSGSSPYWKFIWLTKFQKGKSSNLFTVRKILFISLRLMCTQHWDIYLIQSSLQITCLIIKVLGSNSCKEESCGGFIISFLF